MFECLTGAQAFQGEDIQRIVENVIQGRRTLRPIPATAPASLTRLIDELLEVEPEKRPASASDVKARLRAILDELDVGDPRPWLVDFGSLDDMDADANEFEHDPEAEAETALFQDVGATIRINRERMRPRTSRAPFVFAMVTVAVGLGIGVSVINQLVDFPNMKQLFEAPGMVQPVEDIFLLVRFPGTARVAVDGHDMGSFEGKIRLALTAGEHRLEVRSELGVAEKKVMLLAGTQPVVELEREAFRPEVEDVRPSP